MKAFTDIEQSKKLEEILPVESADMWYAERYAGHVEGWQYVVEDTPTYGLSLTRPSENNYSQDTIKDVPCWSLAALLNELPVSCDDGHHCVALINANPNGDIEWICCYEDCRGDWLHECHASNPVDACYEMVLKIHEKGLL